MKYLILIILQLQYVYDYCLDIYNHLLTIYMANSITLLRINYENYHNHRYSCKNEKLNQVQLTISRRFFFFLRIFNLISLVFQYGNFI